MIGQLVASILHTCCCSWWRCCWWWQWCCCCCCYEKSRLPHLEVWCRKKELVICTDNGKKDVSLTIGVEICLCSLEKKLEDGYVTMFSISIVYLFLYVRNVSIWLGFKCIRWALKPTGLLISPNLADFIRNVALWPRTSLVAFTVLMNLEPKMPVAF